MFCVCFVYVLYMFCKCVCIGLVFHVGFSFLLIRCWVGYWKASLRMIITAHQLLKKKWSPGSKKGTRVPLWGTWVHFGVYYHLSPPSTLLDTWVSIWGPRYLFGTQVPFWVYPGTFGGPAYLFGCPFLGPAGWFQFSLRERVDCENDFILRFMFPLAF